MHISALVHKAGSTELPVAINIVTPRYTDATKPHTATSNLDDISRQPHQTVASKTEPIQILFDTVNLVRGCLTCRFRGPDATPGSQEEK